MHLPAGGRWRPGRVLVVALCLAAGCSRGDDDPTLAGEVPSSSSTTTTTIRETTTTAAACPEVEPAVERDHRVEHDGDVDGDGQVDLVQSFPTSDDATTVTLLVQLAAGGGATLELESEHDLPTALLGTSVVERLDPAHLLFVRVGTGASTVVVGVYWLDGCTLAPVELPNGDPVELPIGGSVRSVSGARCGSLLDPGADLIVYEGRSSDGREFELRVTELRYDAGVLTPSPEAPPRTETTHDPSEVSRLRCGDVEV